MRDFSITESIYYFTIVILSLGAVRSGYKEFAIAIAPSLYLATGLLAFCRITEKGKSDLKIELSHTNVGFMLIVCIFLVITILQGFWTSDYYSLSAAVSQNILFILMVCVTLMYSTDCDARTIYYKVINTLSIVAATLLFIQWIAHLAGINLYTNPFLSGFVFKRWVFTSHVRMSSIFSEPSHLAEFCLLSLFLNLFVHRRIKIAIYLTVAMVMSTSGLGIAGCAILWGMYTIDALQKTGAIRKIVIVIAAMIAVICCVFWFENSTSWLTQRILSGGTSGMRVLRSFELFNVLPWREKIFGVGFQNQANYLNAFGIILPSDLNETLINREYAQTAGYILCTTGLLGFIPCLVCLFSSFIHSTTRYKAFLILFLYVCFTCCVFSRAIFVLYLLLLVFELKAKNGTGVPIQG